MSRETLEWLNCMTLIGDTEVEHSYESWTNAAGQAWHYRAAMQGEEPNHYPGAIPVEDVERRLFGWDPVSVSPMVASYVAMSADGVETVTISDGTRQMIVRPRGALGPEDPGAILGVFKAGYKVHAFREWLVRNIQSILDDTIHVSSAGEAREALAVSFAAEAIDEAAQAFSAEVAKLTNTTVSDTQWAAFLDAHELTTLTDAKGAAKEKASKTHAMNRRAEFEQLYRYDERCKAWQGTAFGVLQTVNTHAAHVRTVRGMSRALRNADMMVTGGVDKLDNATLSTLDAVLASA
jgi:hypothetical protein